MRAIELGCGTGYVSGWMARLGTQHKTSTTLIHGNAIWSFWERTRSVSLRRHPVNMLVKRFCISLISTYIGRIGGMWKLTQVS